MQGRLSVAVLPSATFAERKATKVLSCVTFAEQKATIDVTLGRGGFRRGVLSKGVQMQLLAFRRASRWTRC